jgi:hypothetical protein
MLTTYRHGSRFQMLHLFTTLSFATLPDRVQALHRSYKLSPRSLLQRPPGTTSRVHPVRPCARPVMSGHHFRWSAAIASSTGGPIKSYPAGVG